VIKPRIFIGSSTERLPVARALKEHLADCAEATVWDEAAEFALGESVLDGLIKVGEVYDFALLVFGQDDHSVIRESEYLTVRDNVIFELGLLIGRMGRGRALWLSPRGSKAPHTLTDLDGIIHLTFDEPDLQDSAALRESLAPPREKLCGQINSIGFRTDPTVRVVAMRQALCLASSQYSQARFREDLAYIHNFFPEGVTSEQGVTADRFQDYFVPGRFWDIVHLGLFVDKENQQMLFDPSSGHGPPETLGIEAVEGMIKECRASLVVIITCDSLKFGEHLARFTNVIAGHQAIAPSAAISWAKVFYRALSLGVPLTQAFNRAQDMADPGLILLARKDTCFRSSAATQSPSVPNGTAPLID
jgi:Predicted nucleotide-binding protein containing TIR-like domain